MGVDETAHRIEDEWFYLVMKKYNWIPDTFTEVGIVRSYTYHHPKISNKIRVVIGVHADYWEDDIDPPSPGQRFWANLEPHLIKLSKENL